MQSFARSIVTNSTILLALLCDLVERSPLVQQQLLQCRALQVFAHHMEKVIFISTCNSFANDMLLPKISIH